MGHEHNRSNMRLRTVVAELLKEAMTDSVFEGKWH
jgi:hypothetical protein